MQVSITYPDLFYSFEVNSEIKWYWYTDLGSVREEVLPQLEIECDQDRTWTVTNVTPKILYVKPTDDIDDISSYEDKKAPNKKLKTVEYIQQNAKSRNEFLKQWMKNIRKTTIPSFNDKYYGTSLNWTNVFQIRLIPLHGIVLGLKE